MNACGGLAGCAARRQRVSDHSPFGELHFCPPSTSTVTTHPSSRRSCYGLQVEGELGLMAGCSAREKSVKLLVRAGMQVGRGGGWCVGMYE